MRLVGTTGGGRHELHFDALQAELAERDECDASLDLDRLRVTYEELRSLEHRRATVGRIDDRSPHLFQFPRADVAAVFDDQLEAAGCTEPVHGGRAEDGHLRAGNLVGEVALQFRRDRFAVRC